MPFYEYFLEKRDIMGVTLSNQDGVLTAALTGDIDHHTARELRLAIDEAIERDKPGLLLLDFQGSGFYGQLWNRPGDGTV